MNTSELFAESLNKDAFPERLGPAFAKLRKVQNITQTKIADRLRKSGETIGQTYLSKIESAKKNASLARWKQLCDAIGVPVELLMFEAIFCQQELPAEQMTLMRRMRDSIQALFVSTPAVNSDRAPSADLSSDSSL